MHVFARGDRYALDGFNFAGIIPPLVGARHRRCGAIRRRCVIVNVAIPVCGIAAPLQGGMVFVPLARTFVAASRQRVARIRHRGTLVLVEGCVIQIAGLAVLVLMFSIVSTPRLPVLALGLTIFGYDRVVRALSSVCSQRSDRPAPARAQVCTASRRISRCSGSDCRVCVCDCDRRRISVVDAPRDCLGMNKCGALVAYV